MYVNALRFVVASSLFRTDNVQNYCLKSGNVVMRQLFLGGKIVFVYIVVICVPLHSLMLELKTHAHTQRRTHRHTRHCIATGYRDARCVRVLEQERIVVGRMCFA